MNVQLNSLSSRVWGIDWNNHFPLSIGRYTVELSSFEEFLKTKNHPGSFLVTSDNCHDHFIKDKNSQAKANYLNHACEYFAFKMNGVIVGFFMGEVMDWSTYYIRYIIIAKNHRSNNLTTLFFQELEKIMSEYELDKICLDVSSAHVSHVSRMSQIGYVCNGNMLSERFGSIIRLTKYIKEESWTVFNKSFTQMFYPIKQREETTSSLNL